MKSWLQTYISTHLFYIILIGGGLLGFRAFMAEHDARLNAEAIIKQSESQVKNLQQQIVDVKAAAAQQVRVVTKIVHDVQTPTQAVAAIPQLTNVPLNARISPDNPNQVSVDALALIPLLGQCKTDAINLSACQVASQKQDLIIADKDKEIVALKAKPRFWARIKSTLKIAATSGALFEVARIALGHP